MEDRWGIRDRRVGTPRTFPDEVTGGTGLRVNAQRRTRGQWMKHFSKVEGVLDERYCG